MLFCVRSDLKAWMCAHNAEELSTSVELDEPDVVMETVDSVKEQQSRVMDQLSVSQQQLEDELQIG